MKRNDQTLYETYAAVSWDNPERFERMLAKQVFPRLEYFDRICDGWKGVDVLDLGCGCGYMAEALARRGARVIGIDPCEAVLEAARRHAATAGLAIDYRRGTGEDIPLGDQSVDRVVCVDVLEHVEDPRRVIAGIRRVLRPGGLFLFDTINRNFIARFMMVTLTEDVLRLIPRGAHDPDKFIRPGEVRQYMRESGLECEGEFAGMGVTGFGRDIAFRLTRSTRVVYLGYGRRADGR